MNLGRTTHRKGIRPGGHPAPRTVTKAKKLTNSRNMLDQHKGRAMLQGTGNLIKMHQDIKIDADEIGGREMSDDERRDPRVIKNLGGAYWRQGFHKMQHYGPRNCYRKRIYIPTTRVRKWMDGANPDLSGTSVTYTMKNRTENVESEKS